MDQNDGDDDDAEDSEDRNDEQQEDVSPESDQDRDVWALRNVSIEIKAGEAVAILGLGGSGKTDSDPHSRRIDLADLRRGAR